jgi:hypothetical protein
MIETMASGRYNVKLAKHEPNNGVAADVKRKAKDEEVKIVIIIIKRPDTKRNKSYCPRKAHLLKFLYYEWKGK